MSNRIYICKVNPEEYPEYPQRAAPAVTRGALENRIQFTSIRAFSSESADTSIKGQDASITQNNSMSKIVNMEQTVDMYVRHFKLGRVLWPVYLTLFAENFDELAELCKREGLYLFDFWGYVPGSKPSGDSIWGEYVVPASADSIMREMLGGRFLGYDNGEQDGRYSGYASLTAPLADCRRAQYKNFQAHFEKLLTAMRNHTVTLASLTYLHYFAKEGNTIMLGAETAQALLSSPMWFSFIRGAGKQYGLLWYGNASVWNRWGYKDYIVEAKEPDTSNGYEMGRCAGTSLGLLKRLIYNHYMYNCDILGFEGSWFKPEKASPGEVNTDKTYLIGDKRFVITPVGEIQRDCAEFVERHPNPGVMYTPLAIVADFFAGWVAPRHLYSTDVYKVWGNLPYGDGDYQLHALFSMLYPEYEDAGYFRNERGFDTASPYGEIADVLLSDTRGEILCQYGMAIVLSSVELTLELYLKLKEYVRRGGRLVVFKDMVKRCRGLEKYDRAYLSFFGADGESFAAGGPRIIMRNYGSGTVTMIPGNGLERTGQPFDASNAANASIAQPYAFTADAAKYLTSQFDGLRLVYVSNKYLRYTTNILSAGEDGRNEYLLYVANNRSYEERFDILCHSGDILSAERLHISDGVNALEEYLPLTRYGEPSGEQGCYAVAPGDCQIWRITTNEKPLEILRESLPEANEAVLFLRVGPRPTIKDFILEHPTFSHHFKGVMVGAEYFERLDKAAAEKEAQYLNLQKIRLMIDFSGIIDHFPNLSLIGNIEERTRESLAGIEAVIEKGCAYGLEAIIVTAQRLCENQYTMEQGKQGLKDSLDAIERMCEARGINMVMQNKSNTLLDSGGFMTYSKHYAINTANARVEGYDYKNDLPGASVLLLSAPLADEFGQLYAANKPICGNADMRNDFRQTREKGIPIVMCADYSSWDEVIFDMEFLNE